MPSVRTDVLDLSYSITGPADADAVVLLHGWPDAASGWSKLAPALAESGWRTVVPDLRATGGSRFRSASTPRDGSAAALTQDVLDLADALSLERFAVVGHDWGARVAYSLAAVAPQRISSITALALAYQPRAEFSMPSFSQARAFWYQWLMFVDAGVAAIRRDPVGFARIQWETWSPPGWFDEANFAAVAANFADPDWVEVTLHAYRSRFLDEPGDGRYAELRNRLAAAEQISVPTLMIQGGADFCDEPAASTGQEHCFTAGYTRVVLDGVGHFPHREAPDEVADLTLGHLT